MEWREAGLRFTRSFGFLESQVQEPLQGSTTLRPQPSKSATLRVAHEVGETRVETQVLEQGFYFHVPQPDVVFLISFFQTVKSLIVVSEPRVNKGKAVPRYIGALRLPNAVKFAAVRCGNLGDNFRALSPAGFGAFASAARTEADFRSSQFQSAGSGGRRVNPGAALPARWGSGNFPTTRINSGSSALRGRAATPSFSVSVSNITSKPKLGFGID